MQYDTYYPYTERGLCWYDGTHVGTFPAPPGGEPQWTGLPHGQIEDLEMKAIPGGYELWMTCVSRGIAALTVQGTVSAVDAPAPAPEIGGSVSDLLETLSDRTEDVAVSRPVPRYGADRH